MAKLCEEMQRPLRRHLEDPALWRPGAAHAPTVAHTLALQRAPRARMQSPSAAALTTLLAARDRWISAQGLLDSLPPVREALREGAPAHA